MRPTSTRFFLLDTSVLIDQWGTNRFSAAIAGLEGVIRHSAVAIAELFRGAQSRTELRAIEDLTKHPIVLTPTREMWFRSGRILAKLAARRSLSGDALRRLHLDLLIPLTAHGIGAAVVTTDRADFELLRAGAPFRFMVW